ncbi:MAG: hypothetical protein K5905_11580 [Roseibium sp.]|uniref:hypothetical protein n=1 Tax=Roseibium sp. TaxID=1936156 RepID=UPI002620CF9E|nr:hypothetical protein [Roseibium sp.]MCV0426105.1 hypothetical protein [Roseibium sp.]
MNREPAGRTALRATRSLLVIWSVLLTAPVPASEPTLPDGVWGGEKTRPSNGLPDGGISTFKNSDGRVLATWYGSPTKRYRHGILGDAIEAGSLHVELKDGRRYSLVLPETQVFEDRTPRLVDLDGDGNAEILTIRSDQRTGASVSLYGIKNDQLLELASTKAIGRPNRWLNIAGVEDYAGRGQPQIAYVETPHIGGTLHFVEWRGNKLVPFASLAGFSNHKIGSRHQVLSGDIDFNSDMLPDLAVPSNDRKTLRIVGFQKGSLQELGRISLPSPIKTRTGPETDKPEDCLHFRLENQEVVGVCPPD